MYTKYELSFVTKNTSQVDQIIQKEMTKTKTDHKNVFDILNTKLIAGEIDMTDITLKECNYIKTNGFFRFFKTIFEFIFKYSFSNNINNLEFMIGSLFFLFFVYITIYYLKI